MIQRILSFSQSLKHKSVFLFGARQTGKSTYLRSNFPNAQYFDLLEADTFRELSREPELIRKRLEAQSAELIIIDEIQYLPILLNEVHLLIERNKNLRFILTGSSSRKLKRSGVNLLAGRARVHNLFPYTYPEIGDELLTRGVLSGTIPGIFHSEEPYRDLQDYIGIYLHEEIRAESLVRSIEPYSRFLSTAALSNTQEINYANLGQDAQVPPRTVREYFQLLEDTLLGYQIAPLQKLKKRKPVQTSKFYFFDIGVAHALQGTKDVVPGTEAFGKAFEHLVLNELRAYVSYRTSGCEINFYRTASQVEVDFVVDRRVAIEVKSSGRVSERDAKPMRLLAEDITLEKKIIVTFQGQRLRLDSGVDVYPIKEFLVALWEGEILGLG